MAVTAKQKAEFWESLGKPKSYQYFSTGPIMGNDWSWSKALAGGYSQAEIDAFTQKAGSAYEAHKNKDKSTDPPAPTSKTPEEVVLPGACAKTAAKAVVTAVSQVKSALTKTFVQVNNFHGGALEVDVSSVRMAIKQLRADVLKEVGDQADEYIALTQADDLLAQVERYQTTRLAFKEGVTAVELEQFDLVVEQLTKVRQGNLFLASKEVGDFKKMAQILELGGDTAKTLASIEETIGVASRSLYNGLTNRYLTKIAALENLDIDGFNLITTPNYFQNIADSITKVEIGDAIALPDSLASAAMEIRHLIDALDPEGFLQIQGSETYRQMQQAMDAIVDKYNATLSVLESTEGWLGGPVPTPGSFLEALQIGDLKAAGDDISYANVITAKLPKDSIKAEQAWDEAMDLAKATVPGETKTAAAVTDALDEGLAAKVNAAGTDELNPMVQAKLESEGEVPSLVYFMTKAQKQDYLLDPDFDSLYYMVKYKGEQLEGGGLATAKAKYQAKTGSIAEKAPTPETKTFTAPDGVLKDLDPPPATGTTTEVVEDLTEAKKTITGSGSGADPNAANWEDHPLTPKQAFVIDKHLSQNGIEDVLDTQTLTKGEASKIIGAIKGGEPVNDPQEIAAILGQFEPQTTPTQVKQAMKTLEEGPKVSGQAQNMPTSVAPSNVSWDEPHSFTYVGDGQSMHGGAHRKWMFTDENGDQWMLKNGDEFRVEGELAAHKIAHLAGFDIAEARIATQSTPQGKLKGFMQKMFRKEDIEGELKTLGYVNTSDLARMSADRLRQVQEHQALDWLLGNHDYHAGNFLALKDGRIVGIDKGQAFKWIGADKLDPDWIPPGNFADGAWTYQEMWAGYRNGIIDLDLDAIDATLRRIESMDESELRRTLRAYADGRFKASGSKKFTEGLGDISSADELIEAVIERKRNIRKDFTEFYERMARDRGESWSPSWAKAVDDVLPAPKPSVKAVSLSDVLTPIDDEFAAAVRSTGAAGRSVYVGGTDIERGQILFDEVINPSGGKKMRVHAYFRTDADAKIMRIIQEEAPEAAQSAAQVAPVGPGIPSFVTKADKMKTDAIAGAKTINHHINDGDYKFNENTLSSVNANFLDLKDAKAPFDTDDLGDVVDAAMKKIDIIGKDADQVAAAVVKELNEQIGQVVYKKAADIYRPHYANIIQEGRKGTAATKVPLVPDFDAQGEYRDLKNRVETLVQERFTPGAALDVAEPQQVFDAVTFKRGFHTSLVEDQELSLQAKFRDITTVDSNSNTYELKVTLPSGRKAEILYHDHANSAPTNMGYFEMLMDVEEVTADDIDDAMKFLRNRLGVQADLAKAEDMELSYWRQVYGNYQFSADAKDPGSRYYKALNEARTNLGSLGPNASPREEIEAIKAPFRNYFGPHVDDADYLPIHNHAHTGDEYGWGYFERPELTEADLQAIEDLWVGHRTTYFDGQIEPSQHVRFSASGQGFTGQQERKRVGLVAGGASESADMSSGGSSGFYNTFGIYGEVTRGNYVVWNPKRFHKRLGNYGQIGDKFGQLYDSASEARAAGVVGHVTTHRSGRSVGHHLEPKWWKDNMADVSWNDVVFRDTASFVDDMEAIVVGSQAQRDRVIRRFKDAGLHQIRGVAIEDRIITNGQLGSVSTFRSKMRDLTQRTGSSLRRSFEEAVGAGQRVVQTAQTATEATLRRLSIKKSPVTGTEFGGELTKKLSTGRELKVRARVGGQFAGSTDHGARYHTSENAISIDKSWLQTGTGSQWLTKLGYQTDIVYANAGDRLVLDVGSLGLDLKQLTPQARKRIFTRMLAAVDAENTEKLLEQAALGVA